MKSSKDSSRSLKNFAAVINILVRVTYNKSMVLLTTVKDLMIHIYCLQIIFYSSNDHYSDQTQHFCNYARHIFS
jgi:hypothetical protein